MDNRKLIRNLAIFGAIFIIFAGTLLHFLYQWSGENFVIGLIAPVNESVWEHMKLVFTPMIIFSFIDWYYLRGKVSNYCFSLMKQIGVAIIFIIVFFYLYTSISGESILVLDISSFILGVIIGKWLGFEILTGQFKKIEFSSLNIISAVILVAIFVFFIVATINPPKIGLFKDPVTQTYGINQIIK